MKQPRKQATPALDVAEKAGIAYQSHFYEHDPAVASFGPEASQQLGVEPQRVFKTLVATDGKNLFVGVVPVDRHLDLKAMAHSLGLKSLSMADVALAERTTGYIKGGISPLGQKKRLRTVVDSSAEGHDTVLVSAGKRGLEIELAPSDLAVLTHANFAAIARP